MYSHHHSSVRTRLTYLVVACVVPVWLIAGAMMYYSYSTKRAQINRNVRETARSMSMVVDRELSAVKAALLALGTSSAFDNGNFAEIHHQALEMLKDYPGADIIVADKTGQQVVNSYRPFGSSLPKRKNLETVHQIFSVGKPLISDLYYGTVTKRPMIGIDVPVIREGKVVYDLAMTFPSDRMESLLKSLELPKEWYCTLLDSKCVVVTRTRNPNQYVGKKGSIGIQRILARSNEGTDENINLEGISVLSTYSRSALSNWTVVIGVPKSVIMAEIYQWVFLVIGSAATISLIGIMLAAGIARRITQDIGALVELALTIGRGERVTKTNNLCVKETEDVAVALVQASELLHQRAQERDAAEEELSGTIELLKNETSERVQATRKLMEKERMLIQQSRHAAMGEMIGNIAHQWRQPLNTLGLLIQRIGITYGSPIFNKEFLDTSVSKSMEIVQHMSSTIDDFRNFFLTDRDKSHFRISDAVTKALSLVEASFKDRRITIEYNIHDDVMTFGFPNEYAQVLLNIFVNAKDVILERNIESPRLTISVKSENGISVVTIADNAGGIPEEIINNIFDPYFTTKELLQGTGVGLFMSKTIIENNMGGRLTARNSAEGAEFCIEV